MIAKEGGEFNSYVSSVQNRLVGTSKQVTSRGLSGPFCRWDDTEAMAASPSRHNSGHRLFRCAR